jgi:hypothetical protein
MLCFNSIFNILILAFTPILDILLVLYLILTNLFTPCFHILALMNL